jgi:HK97 family phage portal protein
MGIKEFFLPVTSVSPSTVDAAATPAPFNNQSSFNGFFNFGSSTTRSQAMAVPTIARARNIICSTLASLPLEAYSKLNGSHTQTPQVIHQPDPRVPGSAIYSFIAEDLLFLGVAYGQVLEQYGDTGRIRAWTRVSPDRVTQTLNALGTEIIGYQVDGIITPAQGVGSLVVFYGLDEGLLNRAGRTIRAAHALEQAAESFAKEPVPLQVLKSNGTNLPAERIAKLLESWRTARLNKSTAFLNADVELQALGIDPAKLQLNEARQYVALELARACNLPAYFVSAETTSMTYSNAISERKALIDFSIKFILTAIEQRLSMADFVSSTTEVRFSLDNFLRGDPLQRAQVYEILNRIGAMSVEQIQEEEDLINNEENR